MPSPDLEHETMASPPSTGQDVAGRPSDLQPGTQPGRLSRVLFVAELDPSQQFGTMQEQAMTLAKAFRDRGSLFLPVFVRPPSPEVKARYAAEGLRIEGMNLRPFHLGTLRRLIRLVRSERIEVIDWNFYSPLVNGYLWALSILTPGVRHFLTDHNSRATPEGSAGRNPPWLLKWPFGLRYAKVLCVSDFVLSEMRRFRWRNLARFHHFVNTDRFCPDPVARREVRERLGAGDRFVALVVAFLIPLKGVDVALRAVAELPEDVELWVAGGGPEEAALRGLARSLGVEGRVRFLGPQSRVEPFMQAADFLICPSVWGEAAGLVNLEAPSCGLPVVASRAGGIPEFIEEGRNGFLFPPGDHRALAQRLHCLIEDRPTRDAMSRAARADALKRFSAASRLDENLNLFRVEGTDADSAAGST
jgi:glycosyltransferase involved in cell wall biosynthesis